MRGQIYHPLLNSKQNVLLSSTFIKILQFFSLHKFPVATAHCTVPIHHLQRTNSKPFTGRVGTTRATNSWVVAMKAGWWDAHLAFRNLVEAIKHKMFLNAFIWWWWTFNNSCDIYTNSKSNLISQGRGCQPLERQKLQETIET